MSFTDRVKISPINTNITTFNRQNEKRPNFQGRSFRSKNIFPRKKSEPESLASCIWKSIKKFFIGEREIALGSNYERQIHRGPFGAFKDVETKIVNENHYCRISRDKEGKIIETYDEVIEGNCISKSLRRSNGEMFIEQQILNSDNVCVKQIYLYGHNNEKLEHVEMYFDNNGVCIKKIIKK